MTRSETLCYLAGFTDGEGSFAIGKNGSVEVKVVNSSYATLQLYADTFGGEVIQRSQKVNKNLYYFARYGENAIEFLKDIQPYLIDKKPQCEAILEYWEMRNQIAVVRVPGKRGAFSNPDRELLVNVFRDILQEQKKESS